jgi:hypothetical protein
MYRKKPSVDLLMSSCWGRCPTGCRRAAFESDAPDPDSAVAFVDDLLARLRISRFLADDRIADFYWEEIVLTRA